MNDTPRKPLNVLNPNDKVQQLRQAFEQEGLVKNTADKDAIDRAIDPHTSHLHERVIDALRTVFDPEIPLNVYDLGLIYKVDVDAENKVAITMTLTAPGCPVAGEIIAEVKRKVENVPDINGCNVELVFDPPWTKERMSEAALLELGLL